MEIFRPESALINDQIEDLSYPEGLSSEEIQKQMQEFEKKLVEEGGMGDGQGFDGMKMSLAQLGEARYSGRDFINSVPIPPAFFVLMRVAAAKAEQIGFNPNEDTAVMAYRRCITAGENAIHKDGIGALAKESESIRFLYSTSVGTILYPNGEFADATDVENVHALYPPQRAHNPTDTELLNSAAMQVLPGHMVAFDTTKTWHQAPYSTNRFLLSIDIISPNKKAL